MSKNEKKEVIREFLLTYKQITERDYSENCNSSDKDYAQHLKHDLETFTGLHDNWDVLSNLYL